MLGKIKIKIFVVALVAVLMSFISTSTLAYYSTVGKATNVVTSGNIQFIIHETTDQGKDKRVQGLLNFYKQINTYLQINVNVIKSKVTGDKRGYTVAFDRKD